MHLLKLKLIFMANNKKKTTKKSAKTVNKKTTENQSSGTNKSVNNKTTSIKKTKKTVAISTKESDTKHVGFKTKVNAVKTSLLIKINKFTQGPGKNFMSLIFAHKGLSLSIISIILLVSGIFLPWYKASINFNILNVKSNNITLKLSGMGLYLHIDENLMEPITDEIINKLDEARELILIFLKDEIDSILDNIRTYSSLTNPDRNISGNLIGNISNILNTNNITSDASDNSTTDINGIVNKEIEKLNSDISKLQTEKISIDNDVVNALIQKLINSKKEEILELIDSNILNFIAIVSGKLEVINNEEINKELNTKYDALKWISVVLIILNAFIIMMIGIAKYFEYKVMLKTNIFVNILTIIFAQIYLIFIVVLILTFIGLVTSLSTVEEFFVDVSLVELSFTLGIGIILIGLSAIITFIASIINPIENYRKIKYTKHNEK